MSLASKANSIDLAKREMEIVVKYLEDRNLTNGNTAILWDTPKRDLGFFYNNMKASLEELKSVSGDASSLEKSNILIKLRETLTEQGEKSENITAPNGISRFPHNVAYAVWFVSSIFLALAGVFTFMWGYRYPFP